MAVLPDPDRNFINGLADFWVSLFQDTAFTQAYLQAGQIQIGQVYLDLMQSVLGSSLNHIPLFSKHYYKIFTVREDQIVFEEGRTAEEDHYVFSPEDVVVQANTLMNRVVAPTRTLEVRRDYDVEEGSIKFRVNPFNVTGELDSLTDFPVRSVQVTAPGTCTAVNGEEWAWYGAKPGDTLRFESSLGGPRKEAQILAIDGARLMLDRWLPEFENDLVGKSYSLEVVRTPANSLKTGVIPVWAPKRAVVIEGASTGTGDGVVFPEFPADVDPASVIAEEWYLYVHDESESKNNAFYLTYDAYPNSIHTYQPQTFVPSNGPWTVVLMNYGSSNAEPPTFSFDDPLIDPGSLKISARRLVDVTRNGVLYEAGGAVVEGVDYVVDYEAGKLTYLTPWEPISATYCEYSYRLRVCRFEYIFVTDYTVPTAYYVNQTIIFQGKHYICTKDHSAFATTLGFFLLRWKPFQAPFSQDEVFQLREIAFWAPDVLVDNDALYTNYGYLLGYKKPSSESYRAFLKGVSQLFLLGPTLERFESALNVTAGLPVVRDNGEVLQSFDPGYVTVSNLSDTTLGDGGQLIDGDYGREGYLSSSGSEFLTTETTFYSSDVGAVLRVKTETGYEEYAITSVNGDGDTVGVSPTPSEDRVAEWSYSHNVIRRRFRVNSNNVNYLFSDNDIDSSIVIESADEAKNIGVFRIASVLGPRELVLESTYGFVDAIGLQWRLSKSRRQRVTTSRASYDIPLLVPVRAAIKDSANYGKLTFSAFEALTDVVVVEDYRDNPTWWHRVSIPQSLLSLTEESPGRRNVTPQLIPHIVDALDRAVVDDYGITVGKDDNGETGIAREGAITWLGSDWVRLDFATGSSLIPGAQINDVGQYLTIHEGPFAGFFEIKEVGASGTQVRLDRFPPPPKRQAIAPEGIAHAEIPPILFRRTVAFVLLDRFLKYHAMRIRINTNGGIPSAFITEAARLVDEAKPAHIYVYLEPASSFVDAMEMTDSLELAWGPYYLEHIKLVNSDIAGSTGLGADEYHRTSSGSAAGVSGGGGTSFTITPSFPYTPDRYQFVFGRFLTGTCGGKTPTEGVHYTFNRTTGQVVVTGMDAGAYAFHYIVVALRAHAYATPWWSSGATNGETPSAVHGEDALAGVTPSGLNTGDYGFTDRPLEITIT